MTRAQVFYVVVVLEVMAMPIYASGQIVEDGTRVTGLLADVTVKADPTRQQQITHVVDSLGDPSLPFLEKMRAVESIRPWAEDRKSDFFAQVFLFECRQYEQSGNKADERRDLAFILPKKFFDISDQSVLSVLIPNLDSQNERLRKISRDYLDSYFIGQVTAECINYEAFVRYIAGKKEAPPQGLIRYMYEISPGQAVLTLALLYREQIGRPEYRKLVWSEHVIRDATWRLTHGFKDRLEEVKQRVSSELDSLSQHDAWWVRLYVAEIMRQHPELAVDSIAKRLGEDKHELVRKAMAPDDKKAQ